MLKIILSVKVFFSPCPWAPLFDLLPGIMNLFVYLLPPYPFQSTHQGLALADLIFLIVLRQTFYIMDLAEYSSS